LGCRVIGEKVKKNEEITDAYYILLLIFQETLSGTARYGVDIIPKSILEI
jgi:hypothetical protein